MLREGQAVRITGGPWRGHRALVMVTPQEGDTGPVLCAIERFGGEGRGWDGTPIPSFPSHWVAQGDIVALERS